MKTTAEKFSERILILGLLMAFTFQQAGWARHKCGVKAACTDDQAELAKIAVQDANPLERVEAVKQLTDGSLLAKIAVRDTDCDVRIEAVKKLTDSALLANIAEGATADRGETGPYRTSICWEVRAAAVSNEHLDESVRARVAGRKDELVPLRVVAVNRLTDEADVEEFATDGNPLVSSAAIAKMTNSKRLGQLALECNSNFVCEAAFYRLAKEDGVLAQVAQDSGSPLQPVARQLIRLNRLVAKINATKFNATKISARKRPRPLTWSIDRQIIDETGMYSFEPIGDEYQRAVTLNSRNFVAPSGVYAEDVKLYIGGPPGVFFPFEFRTGPHGGVISPGSAPLYFPADVDINRAINELERVFNVSEDAGDSAQSRQLGASQESNENQPISASAVPATRLEAAIKRIDAVTNVYELKGHKFACIVATREADENAIIGILNGGAYFKATATNWRPLSAEEASKLPKDIREALTSLPKNPLVWLVDVDSLRDPAFDTQYQSLLNNALRALFGTLPGPVIVTLYPPATPPDKIMTNGSIDPSKLAYASLNCSVLSGTQSPSIANSPATVASELIEELTNPNPNVRVSAADALGQSGDGHGNDPRVVEALIATLNDADANVRTSAAQALGKYGDKDPRVIEALIAAMNDDPDANVRVSAVDALGQSGGETGNDPRVVEALIAALNDKALRDGDANVQNSADQALRNYGIATLKDPDANVRVYAAYALGQSGDGHGNDPRVVEALIAALEDTDANVRNSAAQALWNYGDRDPRAVEPLIAALKDPDVNVRDSAVKALRHYGARDPSAVESLIAALENPEATMLGDAAWALGMISRDPSAVESLNAALKDSDAGVRGDAAWALGLFKDPRGVELLIAALKDSDAGAQCIPSGFEPRVNICADDSLVEIGAPAVEPLIAALNGSDSLTREGAAMALGEIGNETGGDHCVEPLIAALNDPDAGVRRVAAWALVRAAMTTGTGAQIRHDAVNALLDAMRKRELAVIAGASRFFIERGEPGSEEVLIQALNAQGNEWVAEDFLNCGNEALEAAAKKWVSGHGYGITYVGVGKATMWGSGHRRE